MDNTAGRLVDHEANNSSLKTHPSGIRLTGITDSIFFLDDTFVDDLSTVGLS